MDGVHALSGLYGAASLRMPGRRPGFSPDMQPSIARRGPP
ncbi:hypothetical protein DA2_0793 [Desulfovibrio sp. A2]|nr:hypothetical protein DA2_0793 [Desulfovibrio sp. A2]